jgi:hypothetical protein
MTEIKMTPREILNQDYLSLTRIQRAITHMHDSVLVEQLRVSNEEQSKLFKDAVRRVRDLLNGMDQIVFNTQLELDIPDELLDDKELF